MLGSNVVGSSTVWSTRLSREELHMPYKLSGKPRATPLPGITQLGETRFLVRCDWIDQRTGKKKKRRALAKSLAEAVALRESLKAKEAAPRRTRLRFADYAEQWLEGRAHRLRPATREKQLYWLARICEHFGGYWLDGISTGDVRAWRDRATKANALSTVNAWHRILGQVLEDAVTDGLIGTNAAKKLKKLHVGRTKGPRGNALDLDEFRRVLAAIPKMVDDEELSEDIGRMLLVIAWTGIRRGELLALRWTDDVDGELRIERAVWRREESATKTDDPRRVTIAGPLRGVLDEQRAWLLRTQHPGLGTGLMFPADPGHAKAGATRRKTDELCWFRTGTVLQVPLERVVANAGVKPISAHSFRRTFENLTRLAGVDVLVRRALAGWRTEAAQGIYATVDRIERDRAADAVVELVNEREKMTKESSAPPAGAPRLESKEGSAPSD
jgi:integrase